MKKQKEQKERDFERLVERQRQTIYSVCYLFANERQEADDLVQESASGKASTALRVAARKRRGSIAWR